MAIGDTVFFNQVDGDVSEEIAAREDRYGAINKPYAVHQWATMKSVHARVISPIPSYKDGVDITRQTPDFGAYDLSDNNKDRFVTLAAPIAGGYDQIYEGGNNVPIPIVNEITLENQGQYGAS